MKEPKFEFAEKHFRIEGSKVQLAGGGDCYIYLQSGSELVRSITEWALASATAEYIQTESVYAGQFTDKEAFLIGTATRNSMAELGISESEALDEAVAEYRLHFKKGKAA